MINDHNRLLDDNKINAIIITARHGSAGARSLSETRCLSFPLSSKGLTASGLQLSTRKKLQHIPYVAISDELRHAVYRKLQPTRRLRTGNSEGIFLSNDARTKLMEASYILRSNAPYIHPDVLKSHRSQPYPTILQERLPAASISSTMHGQCLRYPES